MKRARSLFVLLTVLAMLFLSACGGDDDSDSSTKGGETKESTEQTTENKSPTETVKDVTPTSTPGETDPEESDPEGTEPKETSPEQMILPVAGTGTVFTDYRGKDADAIEANIEKIRAIAANDTMENYAARFDCAPSKWSAEKEYSPQAVYEWNTDTEDPMDCVPIIMISSKIWEDNTFYLDLSSTAHITINLTDTEDNKDIAKEVYEKVFNILNAEYGTFDVQANKFVTWGPSSDNRNGPVWEANFGTWGVTLHWPGEEFKYIELQIEIPLRSAK